jgi:hypothetical protein
VQRGVGLLDAALAAAIFATGLLALTRLPSRATVQIAGVGAQVADCRADTSDNRASTPRLETKAGARHANAKAETDSKPPNCPAIRPQ